MNRDECVRSWDSGCRCECCRPRNIALVDCIVVLEGGQQPVGTMFTVVEGARLPSNVIRCAGQELSRVTYADLYRVIGTTYGHGDGVTTFNLPDLRLLPKPPGHQLRSVGAEKLDLDALESANLGRVVRPEDWMALLAYARTLERVSPPVSGDHHVKEFEEWVKQTGALPWGGSWMAEVSSIIERAAQGIQSGNEPEAVEVCGLKPGCCHKCGLPLSVNPHPEAGKPDHYLEVGCPKECIPCLVRGRHNWAGRAMKDAGDAARYRFLRNKARSVDWSTSHEAEGCTITARFCRVRPDEMDQNIDAAIKRNGEQEA